MGIAHSELTAWDNGDVDLMLAEIAIEADTGRYGESLAEATHPDATPNDYDFPYYYRVRGPYTNQAEKVAKEAEQAFRKGLPDGVDMPAGLFWEVEKVER